MNFTNDYFESLYGNEPLKAYLNAAIDRGNIAHSLIFCGTQGSGKRSAARLLAAAMAKNKRDTRRIADGLCPDVMEIVRDGERKSIGIDTVRTLKQSASLAPNELDYKVYIISDAETMTVQAQNAFLLLLEEPPKNVYFFLLCNAVFGLLPTILSRAVVLNMQIFTDSQLSEYILSKEKKARELFIKDAQAFDFLIRSSGGCIGIAQKQLAARASKNPENELYQQVCRFLSLLSGYQKADFYHFVVNCAAKREELDEFLAATELALRDIVLQKTLLLSGGDTAAQASASLLFFFDDASASLFAIAFTMAELLEFVSVATELHHLLSSNINLYTALIKFSGDMWKIKSIS